MEKSTSDTVFRTFSKKTSIFMTLTARPIRSRVSKKVLRMVVMVQKTEDFGILGYFKRVT